MIVPTIGRVVWFYPHKHELEDLALQPNAALVVYVWHDRMVNLVVFDSNGNSRGETSVTLVQDDEKASANGRFAVWMPYQKGQAAKTEALEKALAS